MRRPELPWNGARVVAIVLLVLGIVVQAAPSSEAESYKRVSGSGSTWSENALRQWISNVQQYGMTIDYAGGGSSQGRQQFANGTVDFAVSEIPFGVRDGASVEPVPTRKFAYMPIVAGGTSFMYNLTIGGRRVTQLRLSGPTLAGIFNGTVTQWNAPAVKADNPGLTLPAKRIVPVVRSDGSGTTAQFTAWMISQQSGAYSALCRSAGRNPCTQTSNFPALRGMVAKSGSDGVAGFVRQAQNEGSITYVEYSYAKNAGFPVAKVLNRSGYYTLPTAQNVAVGLLGAKIDTNKANPATYLTQKLEGVYTNRDARAYPLSSYSYMILPTAVEGTFTAEKGRTLKAFSYYFLCAGQQQADVLGYSPLPINLVKAGFDQVRRVPGEGNQNITVQGCNNPTFSPSGENVLAKNAPPPQACDKRGPTQCGTAAVGATPGRPATGGGGTPTTTGGKTSGATSGQGGGTAAGASGGGSTVPGASPAATSAPGAGDTPVAADGGVLTDETQVLAAAQSGSGAVANPMTLAEGAGWRLDQTLMALSALALLLLVVAPPLLMRRGGGSS